jgi:hypothetical protein
MDKYDLIVSMHSLEIVGSQCKCVMKCMYMITNNLFGYLNMEFHERGSYIW